MAYTKQTWQDDSTSHPLSAARMEYIEQGIADAHALVGGGSGVPMGYTRPADSVDRTGTNNVQAALQTILNGGGKLYLDPGTYRCTSALLLDSNCHIYVAPGAKLIMDFTTGGNTSNSMIRTRTLSGGTGYYGKPITPSHDVWIYGPGEISASATGTGNLFAIAGDRLVMKDFRTTFWNGGRHTIGIGDDWRIINCYFTGGQLQGSGNGGIRYMGGKRFICANTHCDSGDDTFQFVPAGAFTDPFFDVSTEDGIYIGCTGSSSSARLGVIVLQDQNNDGTTGMSGYIRRCGFIGVTGKTGGASMVFQNASSSNAIEQCFISNMMIDGSQNAGTGQPGALYFNAYTTTGGIKKVFIDNINIRGSHRKGVHVDRTAEDILITNSYFERGTSQLSSAVASVTGNVTFENCVFDGLATGTGDIIDIITTNSVVPNRCEVRNCRFINVPGGSYGVDVVNGTGSVISENYFTQKSGATTAQAYRIQAGASATRAYANDTADLTSATKYTDSGAGSLIGTAAITH